MDQRSLKQASKLMSLILRHHAEKSGLTMDPEGYVVIDDLIALMRPAMPMASLALLQAVVTQIDPHKQRFSIAGATIRANYGHSMDGAVVYPVVRPPALLYHGTAQANLDKIRCEGLLPMQRQYVHLTDNVDLARQIGSRHGSPVVLSIAAAKADEEGIVFLSANQGFWLVSALPARFIVN